MDPPPIRGPPSHHYENDGYDVADVSRYQSYDLKCTKSEIEVHVEVKGTTSNGERILLTKNEVAHAREFPRPALFVVTNIARTHSDEETCHASSGKISEVLDPWNIDGGSLDPIAYTYSDFSDNGP